MLETIKKNLLQLRQSKPIVLNLTNFVTTDFVANTLLAIGATPIMSTCLDELEELITLCSAVYINIGTLDKQSIHLYEAILNFSKKYYKPIILDPVGAGASKIRTHTAQSIAPHTSIIRGNASEIMALANQVYMTQGVESAHSVDEAKTDAITLAQHYQNTVVISGPIDFITNGTLTQTIPYGSDLMPLVTGMGCSLTAMIAAFSAIVSDPFEAAVTAAYYFALCGETVAKHQKNVGHFKTYFIDQLHDSNFEAMKKIINKENNL